MAGYGQLTYVIDAKERGRDIVAATHQRPRGVCTEIEVPGGLSGQALMTTTIGQRAILDLPRRAVHSLKHPPVRPFGARSSGTIPKRGLASWGLRAAGMLSSM